jgi:hypothetical protein
MTQVSARRRVFKEQTFRELESLCRTALYLSDDETVAKSIVRKSVVKSYHMNIGRETVRIRLQRGRKSLRKKLVDHE